MSDIWSELGIGDRLILPTQDDPTGEWLVTHLEQVPGGYRVTFMRFEP